MEKGDWVCDWEGYELDWVAVFCSWRMLSVGARAADVCGRWVKEEAKGLFEPVGWAAKLSC